MLVAGVSCVWDTSDAGDGDRPDCVMPDLKVHSGMWSAQDLTDGEDFHTLSFFTNGYARFDLCRKQQDNPYSAPVMAEYSGGYTLNDNVITLELTLGTEAKLQFKERVKAEYLLCGANDRLTLTWLNGDEIFGLKEFVFAFYMYP